MNAFTTSLLGIFLALATASHAITQDLNRFKFEVETLGGRKVTQADYKNNVLIVDFWGTWCPPCRKAIPSLVKLYKKYKHHGLEIVGLNYREKGGKQGVRDFAAEHGITYPLAMGTAKIRKQILNFRGYPTMLFFKRGMKYSHLKVGYVPKHADEIEKWVRVALGLDGDSETKPADKADDEDEEEEDETESVQEGRINRPGNHDTGFEFEVEDTAGSEFTFQSLRGKKVVLAMTSTWDPKAAETAKLLNQLVADYGQKGVTVLAASIETAGTRGQRSAKVEDFLQKHQARYRAFLAGIKFLRKLHKPGGLPTFLVFNEKGVLIHRAESDRPIARIGTAIRATLEGKTPAAKQEKKKPAGARKATIKPTSKPTSRRRSS